MWNTGTLVLKTRYVWYIFSVQLGKVFKTIMSRRFDFLNWYRFSQKKEKNIEKLLYS